MKNRIPRMLLAICLMVAMSLCMVPSAFAVSQRTCEDWMNARIGQALDYDGAYGAQCVDVFNFYLRDVWGISNPIGMYPVGYAYQIFNYNAPAGWEKISGSGNYRVGDVVIWNPPRGKKAGHVGIVYSVDGGTVRIFQQNYSGKYCSVNVIHSTNLIRGVFRPPLESDALSYANISLGKYFIRNNGTNTHLAVSDSGAGSNIMVWARNGNTYEFEMEILSAGTGYRIRPTCSANVVNVYAYTVVNVNLYRDGNNSTQWWGFQSVSGGYVIRNMQNPSVCLSIDSSGYNVYVSTYSGAANQIWSLEPSTH